METPWQQGRVEDSPPIMKCLEQIARCKFNLLAVPGYYDQMVEGLVTCPECLQTFKNPGSLIHHMEVHRGETTCRVCGKVQSRVANLRRHLAKVHGIDFYHHQHPRHHHHDHQHNHHMSKVHGVDMQLQPLGNSSPNESQAIEHLDPAYNYTQ